MRRPGARRPPRARASARPGRRLRDPPAIRLRAARRKAARRRPAPSRRRSARRDPGRSPGTTTHDGHQAQLLHAAISRATSSSASIRSRSRAASSKRRSRASRLSFARSFGRASSSVSHSTPCRARDASCARLRLVNGRARSARRADDAVTAPAEIEVAVGTHGPRVRRRPQLTDQAKLLERRLELRARSHATRSRSSAASAASTAGRWRSERKYEPQPRMQVACAPDVEHLVVLVAEEVDAGPLRRPEREAALALHPPRPRGRQLDEVADGARPALLRHARSAAGGSRPSPRRRAGRDGRAGRRWRSGGESAPRFAGWRPSSRRASPTVSTTVAATSLAGQPHRLVIEERHVEARVVRDEHGVTGEGQEPPDDRGDRRRAAQLHVAEAGQRGDGRLKSLPRVRKQSRSARVSSRRSIRTAPNSQGRADPGRRPVVSRSKTTKVASSRSSSSPGAPASPIRSPDQRSRASARHRVVEQRPREPDGNRAPELQDGPCGLIGGDRAAMLLHELDEPVGGIEAQLHATMLVRTYVRVHAGPAPQGPGSGAACPPQGEPGEHLADDALGDEGGDVRRADRRRQDLHHVRARRARPTLRSCAPPRAGRRRSSRPARGCRCRGRTPGRARRRRP